jgi:hypothetical protein
MGLDVRAVDAAQRAERVSGEQGEHLRPTLTFAPTAEAGVHGGPGAKLLRQVRHGCPVRRLKYILLTMIQSSFGARPPTRHLETPPARVSSDQFCIRSQSESGKAKRSELVIEQAVVYERLNE